MRRRTRYGRGPASAATNPAPHTRATSTSLMKNKNASRRIRTCDLMIRRRRRRSASPSTASSRRFERTCLGRWASRVTGSAPAVVHSRAPRRCTCYARCSRISA